MIKWRPNFSRNSNDKLPIIFGQQNSDPRKAKKDALDWLKGIEKRENS